MKIKFLAKLALLLMLSSAAYASPSFILGWEVGSTDECGLIGGTPTVQTTTKRTGTYAMQTNVTASTAFCQARIRQAAGTLPNVFESVRVYIQIGSLPNSNAKILGWFATTTENAYLKLSTTGTIILGTPTGGDGTPSTLTVPSDSQWHRIEVNMSSTAATAYIDGTSAATLSTGSGVVNTIKIGPYNAVTTNLYFDDFVADSGSVQIGAGQEILLKPTADSSVGSWSAAGTTTNTFQAVDNIPPVGVAAGSATSTSQIHNTSSSTNQDDTYTMQSYTTGGVTTGSVVNSLMALSVGGFESATAVAISGSVWIASNPTQTAAGQTFDFGNGSGGVTIGTFPTGWTMGMGQVAATPTVTLSTQPTLTLRKVAANATGVDASLLGIYVDFVPSGAVHNNAVVIE